MVDVEQMSVTSRAHYGTPLWPVTTDISGVECQSPGVLTIQKITFSM